MCRAVGAGEDGGGAGRSLAGSGLVREREHGVGEACLGACRGVVGCVVRVLVVVVRLFVEVGSIVVRSPRALRCSPS